VRRDQWPEDPCEAALPPSNFVRVRPRPSDDSAWRWWFGSGTALPLEPETGEVRGEADGWAP
jgi:hypothetical protein